MVLPIIAECPANDFLAQYQARKPGMLWYRVINDMQTPLATYAKFKAGQRYSYLLESVQGGENRGRYTIMGADPDLLWRCTADRAEINDDPTQDTFQDCVAPPQQALAELIDRSLVDNPPDLPLMSAMVVGYLGYDCVRWVEMIPDQNPSTLNTPDGFMMRAQIVLVSDTITDILSIVVVCYRHDDAASVALEKMRAKLDATLKRLEGAVPPETFGSQNLAVGALTPFAPTMQSNISSADYQSMVRRAKEYILAGDIFQVVLSQRFSMPFALPPLALFRVLRRSNPSPYLFFFECGDFSITGSSPELMVRLRDGTMTIRPIAGTRRRGETAAEDIALAEELLADPKENAEHLMLLDLGRNDVSRVSEIGSVAATNQFTIERYSHVMHIVSNVEGKLSPDQHRLDALMAGFPAGTVSGAPKIRAMEIIDELESTRRGIYAGCVGYFDGMHNMDNCIALRTAIIKDGVLTVQAGAGIVADSIPEAEHQECVNKAQAIYAAACTAIAHNIKQH
ncbi:MAG: anthranilate synthase component I [Alphaproteobacteria bacterium]|nr:anthranilate synthase component I [Alphaproteobacteria bacterium]